MRTRLRPRRLRLPRPGEPERGSISIWFATCAIVMIILVGLAVDLGGKVHAQQHARDVARQAARAGGQQIQAATAIRGQGVIADPHAAAQAAQTYLAGSGMAGSASIIDGRTVRVSTTETYRTMFLAIIGINRFTVHGRADSRITRSAGGVEQ